MTQEIYENIEYDNDFIGKNTPLSLENYGAIIKKTNIEYTPIDLIKVEEDLSQKSENLINKLVDVYYNKDNTSEEVKQYLEQIKISEATSYKRLMLQTQAMDHMIKTLLERMNSTGSMENSLYKLLTEIIRESNVLTMQVSNYIRNLPQIFKTLKYELETQEDIIHIDKTAEMITEETELNPDNFIKKPQRGMREMLKMADEMMKQNLNENKEILNDDSNIPKSLEISKEDEISEEELLKQMQEEMEENDEE